MMRAVAEKLIPVFEPLGAVDVGCLIIGDLLILATTVDVLA
jgi:hypothetical protein